MRAVSLPARCLQWYSMQPRDQRRHAEDGLHSGTLFVQYTGLVCHDKTMPSRLSRKENSPLALRLRINSRRNSLYILNSTCRDMAVDSRIDSRWGRHHAYAVAYRAGNPAHLVSQQCRGVGVRMPIYIARS